MRITDAQINQLLKPRPTLLELMKQVERRRQPRPLELLGLALAAGLICGVGLLALPFVATAAGVLLPIAAIGLLVRHVVRLHWRRRP